MKRFRNIALASISVLAMASSVASAADRILKFATALPDNNAMMEHIYNSWVADLNAAAKGEFEVQIFGPPFAVTTNVWDRVTSGVAEMGILILPAAGVPFPKSSVSTLPTIADQTPAGSVALWKLYGRGLLDEQFDNVKLMNLTTVPANVFISKKPVTKMEDLAGMKVRANDKNNADALQALGASPIAVPFSEAYQALDKGVVEGGVANGATIVGFRYGELAPNQIANVTFGMVPSAIVINKDVYDSLSEKGKAVIDEFTGEASSRRIGQGHADLDAMFQDTLQNDADYTFHTLDDTELARWQEKIDPIVTAWTESVANGAEVLSAFREEYEKAATSN